MPKLVDKIKQIVDRFPSKPITIYPFSKDEVVIELVKPIDEHCGMLYRLVVNDNTSVATIYTVLNTAVYRHVITPTVVQAIKEKRVYLDNKGYINQLRSTAPNGKHEWCFNPRLIIGLRNDMKKELQGFKSMFDDDITLNLCAVFNYEDVSVHVSGHKGKLIVVKKAA